MNPKFIINAIKIGVLASLLTPLIASTDYYFPFVGPKGLYFMAVAEIIFFLWVILVLHWKQYRPDLKNPVIASVLLFLAVLFVSGICGANFSASFWSKFERMSGILMFCHLTAFFIVISSVFKSRDWVWLFSASSAVAVIVGLSALPAPDGGTIGNDSFWGSYILFNVFISLYIFLSEKWRENKTFKIFGALAFLILTICLLFEGTQFLQSIIAKNPQLPVGGLLNDIINNGARAAKNSFIFGIIFTGFLWLASRKNSAIKTIGRGLLVSSIISGITIMALSLRPGNAVYEIMKNRFGESTIHCRIIVWQIAWRGFLERPLLGWGPENFDLPFARYYNPRLETAECGEVWFDRVHNIVLDTLVNSGIFGLLNYLLIFVVAVYLLWKLYFVGKIGFAQAGIFTALFASYFLQNLTVFDMITSYLMWVLCLGFIAFLYCEKQTDKTGEASLPKPLKFWQVISASIFFAFYFNLFVLKPFFVDRDIITAAKMPYDSVDRLELSRDVLNSSRIGRYQVRIFFAKQLLAAMQDKNIVAKLDIQIIEKEFSLLGGELEKSRWQSPLDFQSRLRLGQLYNMWGLIDRSKFALAGQVLLEAIKLAPQNHEGYVALAQNYTLQGRVKESVDLFQGAYDLYPGDARLKEMLDAVIKIRSQGKNF